MKLVEFQSHGLHAQLATIGAALESFSAEHKIQEYYADIKSKLDYLAWIVAESDAALLTDVDLNHASSELSNVVNLTASADIACQRQTVIANSFSNIFARLPYPRRRRFLKSESAEAVAQFRERAEIIQNKLNATADGAEKSVAAVNDQFATFRTALKASEEEWKTLRTSLEGKLTVFFDEQSRRANEKFLENDRIRDEWLAVGHKQRDEARIKLESEFEIAERRFDEMNENLKYKLDNTLNDAAQDISLTKENADRLLSDIRALYEVAGNTALAGGFTEAARSENQLYVVYSRIAAAFFITAAAVLAAVWWSLASSEAFSLQQVLLRLPISIVFLIPALYIASLSSRHRTASLSLRSLGLRIKAFDAYVNAAPMERREDLRVALADHFFVERVIREPRSSSLDGKIIDKLLGMLEKKIG